MTFHTGSCEEESVIAATCRREGGALVVIASETPFHPRDYQWPDQPEDLGYAEDGRGRRYEVADAIFVAVSPGGDFHADRDIPVRKNSPGWNYFAGHVIRDEDASLTAGERVLLRADAERRLALSRAHSASHLMGPALNRALSGLWRKDPGRTDALGANDFDQLAIESSSISELLCTDSYHIGKSMRKRGFAAEPLAANLRLYEDGINDLIARWQSEDSAITIRAEGDSLASRRYWRATLGGKEAEMPCGGTHTRSLSEIGQVRVSLEMPDNETLIIRTYVR
ncbi:MAG: hypothetical protein LBS75_07740 [Synergistaceae bacterium]|nr:hypothetical protein [Synergistaceae bacterium]